MKRFVGHGGTLLVIAAARDAGEPENGPPWPVMRAEIDSFASDGLQTVSIERMADTEEPSVHRWRAEFERGA